MNHPDNTIGYDSSQVSAKLAALPEQFRATLDMLFEQMPPAERDSALLAIGRLLYCYEHDDRAGFQREVAALGYEAAAPMVWQELDTLKGATA